MLPELFAPLGFRYADRAPIFLGGALLALMRLYHSSIVANAYHSAALGSFCGLSIQSDASLRICTKIQLVTAPTGDKGRCWHWRGRGFARMAVLANVLFW